MCVAWKDVMCVEHICFCVAFGVGSMVLAEY